MHNLPQTGEQARDWLPAHTGFAERAEGTRVIARRTAVGMCAGRVRIGDVQVTLRAPPGDRSLVHGSLTPGQGPRDPERLTPWCPRDAAAAERLDVRRLIGLTVREASAEHHEPVSP